MTDNSYDFAPRPEGEKPPADAPAPSDVPAARLAVPPPAAPATPAPAVKEMLCPHCGFRVVGKPPRGRCPECSAAIDDTAMDFLQFASPGWTRGIAWGPILMSVAIFGHLLAVALVWRGSAGLGQILHVLAGAALAAGAWIVTSEEPPPVAGQAAPQRRPAAGLIGRWSAVAVAALWVLVLLVFFAHRTGSMHPLTALVLAVWVIEAIFLGAFLTALAARIPHDGLATQFLNLAGIMPVVLGLLIVAQFIDITPWLTSVFFCMFPLLGGLAGLVIWAAVTMLRLSLEIRGAASAAEAIAERKVQRLAKQKQPRG